MQIASFILVNDRAFRQFEEQLEHVLKQVQAPQAAFANVVPSRLHELGAEHPISIPVSSLYPLDAAAQRQHARIFSAFEDPLRPTRLRQMATAANVPLYYISPGRVREFTAELEALHLAHDVKSEDVENLIGHRVTRDELPDVILLLEEFRHDLYQVYRDATLEGKGIIVVVVNQPDEATSEQDFPRAA
jgi:hypothetical protein